jgi:uncharacterized membrane protein YhiD involved in acid resistance
MAGGAGQFVVATVGTAIILFSLWPLNRLAERVRGLQHEIRELRLQVVSLATVAEVSRLLTDHQLEILSIETASEGDQQYAVEFGVRVPSAARLPEALAQIERLKGVEALVSTGRGG